jgi:hypothetical protein
MKWKAVEVSINFNTLAKVLVFYGVLYARLPFHLLRAAAEPFTAALI